MWVMHYSRAILIAYSLGILFVVLFGLIQLGIYLIPKLKAGRLRRRAVVLKKTLVRPEGQQPTQAPE